jgi:hypothetical protein
VTRGQAAEEARLLERIAAAHADFESSRADLQETLDHLQAQPLLSDEERRALERQAASGSLGKDMQALAEKVRAGEDSWESVFEGSSPHAHLMQSHLTALVEEHGEDLALAWEDLVDAELEKGNDLEAWRDA